ncbi:MAG: DUF1273 domain-containing protein, partial [Oscillospiraceae bacterium]|nr:DUF1273 domain-containing protein [Oscillospiraceae bacterium]
AIGFDTLCAETVIELRQKYPQIRLCLLLPCPPEEQTMRWRTDQKEKHKKYYHKPTRRKFARKNILTAV